MLEGKVEEHKQEFFEHKKELDKSKQLEKDLRKDVESVCVECNKLNNNSVHAELRKDALVEN